MKDRLTEMQVTPWVRSGNNERMYIKHGLETIALCELRHDPEWWEDGPAGKPLVRGFFCRVVLGGYDPTSWQEVGSWGREDVAIARRVVEEAAVYDDNIRFASERPAPKEPNTYGWSTKPTHMYVLHHELPHDYLTGCAQTFADTRKWEWEEMSSVQKFDEMYEHIREKVLEYVDGSLDEYDAVAYENNNVPQFIQDLYGYARRRINAEEVAKTWTSDFMGHYKYVNYPDL